MTNYRTPDHNEIIKRVERMAEYILSICGKDHPINIVPVPRGGIPVTYLLLKCLPQAVIYKNIEEALSTNECSIFVDDVIDSGNTMKDHNEKYPSISFFALYNKIEEPNLGWIVFPWEGDAAGSIEDAVTRSLQFIGEDPKREGLLETPARVVKSWKTLFSGYKQNPKDCFKTFEVKFDELVILKDVELFSTCEHHMLPFIGRAHIAYIADGKVIGVSKLARLMEVFARRLQIQERLGAQIVDTLMKYLQPKGAACIIEAKHLCMSSRGVNKQHSSMITSAMRGIFLEDSPKGIAARSELMVLIRR